MPPANRFQSYEQRGAESEEPYNRLLEKNKGARGFFQAQTTSLSRSGWLVDTPTEATEKRSFYETAPPEESVSPRPKHAGAYSRRFEQVEDVMPFSIK